MELRERRLTTIGRFKGFKEVFDSSIAATCVGTTSDRGHCQWIENIYYTEKHSCRISVCIKRDLTFGLTSRSTLDSTQAAAGTSYWASHG